MKKVLFTLVIILSICITAIAATIEIELPPLKYVVNGVEVAMPDGEGGFLYNDRTYVPIRFISEALNKDVSWDNETNTVIISDKKSDYFELKDGSLYKNGNSYDIKPNSEVIYKKLYDNKLVYYITRNDEGNIVYDVYLCNLETMLTEKIDTTADFVGDIKNFVADYIFDFLSVNYESCRGVINLKTGDVDYIKIGHQACMVWDNETLYYSNIADDGIYSEVIGQKAELLCNIGTNSAWMLLYDSKLYCYNADEDKGAVIELKTNKVISKELTQKEKNSVILRNMLYFVEGYNNGHEYEPEFTDKKVTAKLIYKSIADDGIVFFVKEKQYPTSVFIGNNCGKLELPIEVIGDDKIKIKLNVLNTKDKERLTQIIIRQIGYYN